MTFVAFAFQPDRFLPNLSSLYRRLAFDLWEWRKIQYAEHLGLMGMMRSLPHAACPKLMLMLIWMLKSFLSIIIWSWLVALFDFFPCLGVCLPWLFPSRLFKLLLGKSALANVTLEIDKSPEKNDRSDPGLLWISSEGSNNLAIMAWENAHWVK